MMSIDRSKAFALLHSFGGFILGVCVAIDCPHLSFFWYPRKTVLRDCGIS